MTPENILFSLLRSAVCGEAVTEQIKDACTADVLEQVYILAKKHDLAHLAGHVLCTLGMPEKESLQKMKQAAFSAVYRQVRMDAELERICETLEEAQIPFIPLKGAVLRKIYPQPWMRTSCDIDVLVHENDLDAAVEALTSRLAYTTDHKKHYHDMSLFSGTGVHLELHFSILETMDNIDALLGKVWDYAIPVTEYHYVLQNEFFAFHQIAHMSYHFTGGGCGIRPFLDIYLLKKQNYYDEKLLRNFLAKCGLERFYDSVCSLIGVWLENNPHTPLTKTMECFLLTGGVYGSEAQRIAIQQQRKGGKLGYLLRRIYMPYHDLKIRYRILEKHPVLFPVMQIYRWIELPFSSRLQHSIDEAKINMQTDKRESDEINSFLRQVGL